MYQLKFVECDTCKKKPGSPALCEGCLNNRAVIAEQKSALDKLHNHISWMCGRAIDQGEVLLGMVLTGLRPPAGCTCTEPYHNDPTCTIHGR